MNYQASVEYLLSLGNEVTAMKLGLENIRKLLHVLDDPHKKYLKVQVAGTNAAASRSAICFRISQLPMSNQKPSTIESARKV